MKTLHKSPHSPLNKWFTLCGAAVWIGVACCVGGCASEPDATVAGVPVADAYPVLQRLRSSVDSPVGEVVIARYADDPATTYSQVQFQSAPLDEALSRVTLWRGGDHVGTWPTRNRRLRDDPWAGTKRSFLAAENSGAWYLQLIKEPRVGEEVEKSVQIRTVNLRLPPEPRMRRTPIVPQPDPTVGAWFERHSVIVRYADEACIWVRFAGLPEELSEELIVAVRVTAVASDRRHLASRAFIPFSPQSWCSRLRLDFDSAAEVDRWLSDGAARLLIATDSQTVKLDVTRTTYWAGSVELVPSAIFVGS